jgi:hypothetical protein
VLYNHHTPEAGEMEIMLMIDIGQQPDGIRYTAQMAEFRLASTDKFITEFMIEGQTTSGEDGYNFTGQGRSAGVRLRQHLPARRRHVLRRTDLDASKLAWIPKT